MISNADGKYVSLSQSPVDYETMNIYSGIVFKSIPILWFCKQNSINWMKERLLDVSAEDKFSYPQISNSW